MKHLLDQLTKPQILSDGTIREPNAIMRKAAEIIIRLVERADTDTRGRLLAEKEAAENLRICTEPEAAIEYYKQAMNDDYIKNFT